MGIRSQERGVEIPKIAGEADSPQQQKKEKASPLQCPRCDSTNTKFCYYNNYSKLQPRHFCKACRRYWTEGGVLRDVPVGRSRKNKRLKTAHGTAPAFDVDGNGIDSGGSSTTIAAAAGQQPPPVTPSDVCPPEALLHESLLHPPQLKLPAAWDCIAGSYVDSAPSAPLLPQEYVVDWAEEPAAISSYRFEDMFDPFSHLPSSSCSSPHDDHARRDARLVAVDGASSSWQVEGHEGRSHLSRWDEVLDIVYSEFNPPGSV